jgi:hypothetical protein
MSTTTMPRLIPSAGPGHFLESETPKNSEAQLESDSRWQLARRVAASKKFAKSGFLSDFILYVREKYPPDRVSEITEQRIGRPVGYSSSEDNIVRNYARLLPQRLDESSRPLLKQILAPNGELASFEVLIETSDIGANAPRPRIISQRIYHQFMR